MKETELLHILFELSKAIRFCHQEEICGESITFIQFNILNQVYEREVMPMAALHEALRVDKSTTTRLLDPLVKKELIIKEKARQDSRSLNIRLTEEGRLVRDRAWACLQEFMQSVDKALPENEKSDIYRSVKTFAAVLQVACCSDQCCHISPEVI